MTWVELYGQMLLIREFENVTVEAYRRGRLPGLVHASIGQEAASVGTISELAEDDYVATTHRGHGHCIAKGMPIQPMLAEVMGRADGSCGGKGGSMHLMDFSRGVLGANGIVGGGVGIALGAAFSARYRQSGQISVVFFGEGAINQGVVAETMNIASLWKLPLVYICENNGMVEYTRAEHLTAGSIADRAQAYGIPAETVDGMDLWAVRAAAARAVSRARSDEGPAFLELITYRYHGHHVAEFDSGYRTKAEIDHWRERDPLSSTKARLMAEGLATAEHLDELEAATKAEVRRAYEAAAAGPEPSPKAVHTNVFAEVPA